MLDIGFAEILIVAVVALVVLGPEKLPMAIKTLGMWIGKAKRTISGIQSEISEELRLDELKRTTAVAKEQLEGELAEMKAPFVDSAAEKTAVKQPETTQLKDEAVPLEEQIVSLDKKSS
ncbi:Sec-independent protein translocase protein TatB [Gammaproteobacteria bacterium AS21]|jgi:sec-independent protein translocase protein TatB